MRGEHRILDIHKYAMQGSSPHARGTHPAKCLTQSTKGIIPACAGNTCGMVHGRAQIRDHPRMRGEHLKLDFIDSLHTGSSPHARGTPRIQIRLYCQPGIIPACAGNTTGLTAAALLLTDHPRMRGEHTYPAF